MKASRRAEVTGLVRSGRPPRALGLVALVLAVLAGCGDARVEVFQGGEHCGWETVDIIRVSTDLAAPLAPGDPHVTFVRDLDGVLLPNLVFGEFESRVALPNDAVDTGVETPHGQLWLSESDPRSAYLINWAGRIDRWPAGDPGCD